MILHSKPPRDSRVLARARFTLIELLVVVAIISILAALLLPALSEAKSRTIRVSCLSRIKGLGIALSMYADDHASYYPTSPEARHYSNRPGGNAGFFNSSIGYGAPRYGNLHVLFPDYGSREMFLCTGVEQSPGYNSAYWFGFLRSKTPETYAMTAHDMAGYSYLADGWVRAVLQGRGTRSVKSLLASTTDLGTYWGPVNLQEGRDVTYAGGGVARPWPRIAIAHCLIGDAANSNGPYGVLNAGNARTFGRSWNVTGHRAGDPKGANMLIADGSAKWVDLGYDQFKMGYYHAVFGDWYNNVEVPE